ncbi:MAG: hypothetical protein RL226_1952 [Bacteroidota bacterium]
MIAPHIQQTVSELIYHAECVIIPGFGGFVANEKPARLNTQSHRVYPPSREVSFNQRLVHNDGLLAQEIRLQLGCSYEVAMGIINGEVEAIKQALEKGRQVALFRVGVLFLDRLGNLQFAPSDERNFLPAAFGLNAVELSPIMREIVEQGRAHGADVTPVVAFEKSARKGWRNLAAAAAVPLLIATGWFAQQDTKELQFAFITPSAIAKVSTYQPRFEEEAISLDNVAQGNPFKEWLANAPDAFQWDFDTEMPTENGTLVLKNVEIPVVAAEMPQPVQLYFIVGGAFKEESNATAYVAELRAKGYSATVCDQQNGLYLVAYNGYASKNEANSALSEIQASDNPHAWLKRMK